MQNAACRQHTASASCPAFTVCQPPSPCLAGKLPPMQLHSSLDASRASPPRPCRVHRRPWGRHASYAAAAGLTRHVRHKLPGRDEQYIDGDKGGTSCRGGALSDVDGHRHRGQAHAQAHQAAPCSWGGATGGPARGGKMGGASRGAPAVLEEGERLVLSCRRCRRCAPQSASRGRCRWVVRHGACLRSATTGLAPPPWRPRLT